MSNIFHWNTEFLKFGAHSNADETPTAPPDIPVIAHWWNKEPTMLHSHQDYYEIFFVVDGEIKHIIDGETQILPSRTLGLIRPGEKHKLSLNANTGTHYNLSIESSYFEELCGRINPLLKNKIDAHSAPISFKLPTVHFNYFLNLAKSHDITRENSHFSSQILRVLVEVILLDVNTRLPKDEILPRWLQNILIEINMPSFMQKSVHDVYALAPCAPCTLIDYFHKYLQCTPSQYLTKKKVAYASQLLKSTNFTVLHIAYELGFNSLSHFNKIFRKEMGLPPNQYRKKMLGLTNTGKTSPSKKT